MAPSYPIERLRCMLGQIEDGEAAASVAILLKADVGGLQVLLVRRAIIPSDPWSGDMAFPGGRRHLEDGSLWETAFRETLEETGIDLRGHLFLGAMDITSSTVEPEMRILPFVFLVRGRVEILLSRELSSYLWTPLDELRRSKGVARVHAGDVPAYILGGEVVWGLTYRMLEDLLRLLEAPVE